MRTSAFGFLIIVFIYKYILYDRCYLHCFIAYLRASYSYSRSNKEVASRVNEPIRRNCDCALFLVAFVRLSHIVIVIISRVYIVFTYLHTHTANIIRNSFGENRLLEFKWKWILCDGRLHNVQHLYMCIFCDRNGQLSMVNKLVHA